MILLSKIFSSEVRVKLLAFFFAHPTEEYHINGLAKLLEISPSSLQGALYALEESGILESRKEANLRYFKVNENSPIYDELKKIILKTVGLGDMLRENLSTIGEIQYAFIYGSFARGDERESSDIDLMIIGSPDEGKLLDVIRESESILQRVINYTIYSLEEWSKKKAEGNSFVVQVISNKRIELIGNSDEL